MKVALFFFACLTATQAGIISYPFAAPTLVRTPGFDSAIIQANRFGGNFAYSSLAGHSFAAINPYGLIYTHPVAVSPPLLTSNVYPGTFLVPGQSYLPAVPGQSYLPAVPAAGEVPKEAEKPTETPAAEPAGEEPSPAAPEATPEEEAQAPENVDESVGEANNDGADEFAAGPSEADESSAPVDAPQADDVDSVSVDASA